LTSTRVMIDRNGPTLSNVNPEHKRHRPMSYIGNTHRTSWQL
jgi:hypothetical protein